MGGVAHSGPLQGEHVREGVRAFSSQVRWPFRFKIEGVTDREDFSLEDDLADWEFAEAALKLWKQRVEILRHAAA